MPLALFLCLLALALPVAAQEPVPSDAYLDAGTRELVGHARARRALVDSRITAYQTTVHERFSARLAVARFERLIFRRETVARIAWTRDTVRIEVLGSREAQPLVVEGAVHPPADLAGMLPALAFDPVDSEMLLRVDSTELLHPLSPGSEAHYRFASGDTTSLRLHDGRTVRLLELRISARRPDSRLIHGSFWVDEETHAVVRAGFRLSRPRNAADSGVSVVLPQMVADLDHVAIEYGLWELRWWLPRAVIARGLVRVGGTRLPLSYERRYEGYRVEGSTDVPAGTEGSPLAERPCRPMTFGSIVIGTGRPGEAAWDSAFQRSAARAAADSARVGRGSPCTRAFLVTRAPNTDLVASPAFPTGVYKEDDGPVGAEERRALAELAAHLPESPWATARPSVQLLTPELLRFNRVEGLSFGARADLPLGPLEARAEARLGTTGELGAHLAASRSGRAARVELAAYRRLEAVEVAAQPFSLAGSAAALLLGRDDNDYFRGTGAELRITPPAASAERWELRLFGERQTPVRARSLLSLRALIDGGFEPRENLSAEPLDQLGATLRLRAGPGDDPGRARARGELELHAETGDASFARPLVRLGLDAPAVGRLRLGLELAAGTALGSLPAQRAWQLGGSTSVRGQDPAALRGESFWLARGEVAWGAPALRLGIFGDAGWAGDPGAAVRPRPLHGAGIGLSLLDGLLRLDLARGLGGGVRLHLRMGGGL